MRDRFPVSESRAFDGALRVPRISKLCRRRMLRFGDVGDSIAVKMDLSDLNVS